MVACAGRQSCSLKKRIAMDNLFKIFKCWSHEIVSQPKTSQEPNFLSLIHSRWVGPDLCAGILFSQANTSLLGFHRSHALFLLNYLFVEEQLKLKLSFSTNRILKGFVIASHTQKRKTCWCQNRTLLIGLKHSKTHILICVKYTVHYFTNPGNAYGNPNLRVTSMSLQHT